MIEESKLKKQFNKELVMTKEGNEKFQSSTKCWICDNDYVDNDIKARNHCQITRKYTGSALKDCNVNLKSNHKVAIVFHNLMQELGKLKLKINVISNGLEKYISCTINNKLSFY